MRRMMKFWLAIACAFALPIAHAAPSSPLVRIAQGALRGVVDQEIESFRNIPYVAPPVGELRWRAPAAAPHWSGERDATRFGAICPQTRRIDGVTPDRSMNEDCLQLNIWTRDHASPKRMPVMVWLLPGGFTSGDAGMARYDGTAIAREGIVVVSFNYRLGILGEFAHPALRASSGNEPRGNFGLMDQIAALRWVRDNIAAFGGDPHNVTIFGMSAGGMSVNYLMASPMAKGLFHKAISESSALRLFRERRIDQDSPGVPSLESEGRAIAGQLGIPGDDDTAAHALRALDFKQILEFQRNNRVGTNTGLTPVIDGRVLERSVGEVFRDGQQHPVPYMTGATTWEASLARGLQVAEPILGAMNVTREEAAKLYPGADDRRIIDAMYSEFFLSTQRFLAREHAKHGHVAYGFVFGRVSEATYGNVFGAEHGASTDYVFGTHGKASENAYADRVRGYWVRFAKTGNPNDKHAPRWPRVTPKEDAVLEFAQPGPLPHRQWQPEVWQFFLRHFEAGKI